MKAAINKKISDFMKKVKKKIFSIFQIFTTDNDSDENEMMVEMEKKLDKLKQMINKVTNKLSRRKDEHNK
jgi:cob(I)alamin adenosyltransferase